MITPSMIGIPKVDNCYPWNTVLLDNENRIAYAHRLPVNGPEIYMKRIKNNCLTVRREYNTSIGKTVITSLFDKDNKMINYMVKINDTVEEFARSTSRKLKIYRPNAKTIGKTIKRLLTKK